MAATAIDYRFVVRRGTAAAWTASNQVLLQGEFGLETDTNMLKMGDGSTAWNSLAYWLPGQLSKALDTAFSAAQGAVLYRDASAWKALAPGAAGQVLQSGGANANPSWATPSSGGGSGGGGGTKTIVQKNSNSYLNNGNGSNSLKFSSSPTVGNYVLFLVMNVPSGSGGACAPAPGLATLANWNFSGGTNIVAYGGIVTSAMGNPTITLGSSSGSCFEISGAIPSVSITEAYFTTSGSNLAFDLPGAFSNALVFWVVENYGSSGGNTPTISNIIPSGAVLDYNIYNNSSECFQQFRINGVTSTSGVTVGFSSNNNDGTAAHSSGLVVVVN